jgi:NAD(P)-dependent dehydrogenase (short-subunit alcohol dehydrogenase family)
VVRIEESTVVVTGGQRGLGKAIVTELLERGAAKVYTTARTPKPSNDLRVVDVTLDVTNADSVAALATTADDATIVINNASADGGRELISTDLADIRDVFETNYFGALRVAGPSRPFWPATVAARLSASIRCCRGWLAGGIWLLESRLVVRNELAANRARSRRERW